MAVKTDNPHPTNCPRCGYDQRGEIAKWIESCPMTGVCTECGLQIDWGEVLHARAYEPRWCIEFADAMGAGPLGRGWIMVRAAVSTLVRSGWPWAFWSRIRLAFPIRQRRLALYMAFLTTFLITPCILWQATLATMMYQHHVTSIRDMEREAPDVLKQLRADRATMAAGTFFSDNEPGPARATLPQMVDTQIARLERIIEEGINFDVSFGHALASALLSPFDGTSPASFTIDGYTYDYPAPIDLYTDNLEGSPIVSNAFYDLKRTSWRPLLVSLLLWLAFPGLFILLPISRRTARIRWGHIGRAMAYSVCIPWAIIAVGLIFAAALLLSDEESMHWQLEANLRGSVWVLLPLWWWAVISRYFRMSRSISIVISFMTVLLLIVFAVDFYVFGKVPPPLLWLWL